LDEAALRMLLEETPAVLVDASGVVLWHRAARRGGLGYEPFSRVGRSFTELVRPESHEAFREMLAEAMREGRSVRELQLLHAEGKTRVFDAAARRLSNDRILLTGRDVTEHRNATLAAQRGQNLLAAIADVQSAYISGPETIAFAHMVDAFRTTAECAFACVGEVVTHRSGGSAIRVLCSVTGSHDTTGAWPRAIVDGDETETVLGTLVRTQRTVIENAPVSDDRRGPLPLLSSTLCEPLVGRDGGLVGLIVLGDRAVGFDQALVDRLRPLFVTAASIVEAHRAQHERREAERRLELLKTLAIAIGETKDLEASLQIAVRTIANHARWDLGQAWVPDGEGKHVECTEAWFTNSPRFKTFHDASRAIHLGPNEGMPGRVWASKRPEWIDEIDAKKGSFPRVAVAREVGLVVSFAMPVMAAGELVAVLEFFSARRQEEDEELLELVAACAAQLGTVLARRKAEQDRALLEIAVRDMHEPVLIIAPSSPTERERIIYVNPAYTRLMGYELDDVRNRNVDFHFGPLTDMEVFGKYRADAIQGRYVRANLVLYRSDGTPVEIETSGSPVFDEAGRRSCSVAIWREIGTQKREAALRARLETEVQEANVAWRKTFDAIDLPILLIAADDTIERVNEAAWLLAGARQEEILGRKLADLGDREPWGSIRRMAGTLRQTHKHAEVLAPDVESGKTWDVSLSPTDTEGAGIAIVRDVTSTMRLQEELRRNETVAALGRLVAGVAHEVRNPLFGIGATLDAFTLRFGTSPDHASYVSTLRSELGRLADLMRDLLDYGRPPGLQPSPYALSTVVEDAVLRCGVRAIAGGVRIEHVPSKDSPELLLDRGRMTQVFINLIENAIQHAYRSGRVRVKESTQVIDGTAFATVAVEDDGPGFAPADLPRIFEPFYTKRQGGTGLGLSIVQRIVEQHGGRVTAANRPEGGAVMTVMIPTKRGVDAG
jgi:PAS domain S-box-containing protein